MKTVPGSRFKLFPEFETALEYSQKPADSLQTSKQVHPFLNHTNRYIRNVDQACFYLCCSQPTLKEIRHEDGICRKNT